MSSKPTNSNRIAQRAVDRYGQTSGSCGAEACPMAQPQAQGLSSSQGRTSEGGQACRDDDGEPAVIGEQAPGLQTEWVWQTKVGAPSR